MRNRWRQCAVPGRSLTIKGNRHFTTGPVARFLVDDVFAATEELRSAGSEILLEPGVDDSGNAWVHFRAPDGNIYELTPDPGVHRPG